MRLAGATRPTTPEAGPPAIDDACGRTHADA